MSISILRKLIIRFAAAEDARGFYGRYLMERQKPESSLEQLNLSSYMAQLVINYTKKSQRKASRNLYLQWKYGRIMNQCTDLEIKIKTQNADVQGLNDSIVEANREIQRLKDEKAQLDANWNYINSNGKPAPGTAAMTISDLTASIDRADSALKTQMEERDRLQDQLGEAKTAANTQKKLAYDRLTRLVLSYQRKIERLYEAITAYGNRCDEHLNYYWRFLCKNLAKGGCRIIREKPKTFAEICELRGTQLMCENELFRKERNELNQRLSNFPNFKVRL